MIALTKEFRHMLQELFESRGVTEISTVDLVTILDVNMKDLETFLQDAQMKNEYKIVQAEDGTLYVKRFLDIKMEGKKVTSTLKKVQWDNIGGCPCFTCHELDRCDVGNPISSIDCPLFSRWLFAEQPDGEEE